MATNDSTNNNEVENVAYEVFTLRAQVRSALSLLRDRQDYGSVEDKGSLEDVGFILFDVATRLDCLACVTDGLESDLGIANKKLLELKAA